MSNARGGGARSSLGAGWLLCGVLVFSPAAFASEPNETPGSATDLRGARLVSDSLGFATEGADTTLGLFAPAGDLLAVDDDGSFLGNGFASALTGFPVNADGSIRFAVSGVGDFDFDGALDAGGSAHTESGMIEALLTVFGSAGQVIDTRTLDGELLPGSTFMPSPLLDPAWIGGTFDLEINNFLGPPSDVDHWLFSDTPPGAVFTAEIIEGQIDTLLGQYNDQGDLIAVDDEGGVAPLSRLTGVVPASGQVRLAVTAFPDFDFEGVHSVTGQYTLRLTVVPEPTSLAIGLVAAGISLGTIRRRPSRSPRSSSRR